MIRGTKRGLAKPPTKRFDVNASIHNRFDLEVVDSRSGEVKEKLFAENVICDQMWSRLMSNYKWGGYIHYGTGSGTPSPSDTSLFNYYGYKITETYATNSDIDSNVYSATVKAQISESEAVGETITELGIAYDNLANHLMTHAMLKDMNGNPVSLQKSDTDVVNIYATVFVHLNLSAGTKWLGLHARQSSSSSLGAAAGFLAYFAGLTASPTNPFIVACKGYVPTRVTLTPTYTKNAETREFTVTCPRMGVDTWNSYRGLKNIHLAYRYSNLLRAITSEFSFDVEEDSVWYPKTPVLGEALGTGDGVTKDFSTKFNFAKNITVYADGVPVDATVDYGCGLGIGYYLKPIFTPLAGYTSNNSAAYDVNPMYAGTTEGQFFLNANWFEDKPVFQNMLYETHGISKLVGAYKGIRVSNDMKNWVDIPADSSTTNIPDEYQHYRYWSLWCTRSNEESNDVEFYSAETVPTTINVHLSEAPAEGAVITADYDAICVAKDENHVFDLAVVFKFNEYTET